MSPDEILRQSRSNFSMAFSGLAPKTKEALSIVYAYCRCVDDIVDEATSTAEAQAQLDQWYKGLGDLSTMDHPLAPLLVWVEEHFDIHISDLRWLLHGMQQDLAHHTYQTWEQLFAYCDAVASSVGLLCLDILGVDSRQHVAYALATGRALQLTNILRDVKEDAQRGRVYLPKQHWQAFELQDKDFKMTVPKPQMKMMLAACMPQVDGLYIESNQLSTQMPLAQIWPTRVMADVYHAIFQKIQYRPMRIFQGRVKISAPRQLWLAKKNQWRAQYF